jgi:hypothetical protein
MLHTSCYLPKIKGKKALCLSMFMTAPKVLHSSWQSMKCKTTGSNIINVLHCYSIHTFHDVSRWITIEWTTVQLYCAEHRIWHGITAISTWLTECVVESSCFTGARSFCHSCVLMEAGTAVPHSKPNDHKVHNCHSKIPYKIRPFFPLTLILPLRVKTKSVL